MAMLVCSLCGKMSPANRYDPSNFEDDIFFQEVKGLGRGHGFRNVGARSIFESVYDYETREVAEKMCDRSLEIIRMMLDNDVITQDDVVERLGLTGSGLSNLAYDVLRFLEKDSVQEFLYDADEETQQQALPA